MNAIVLALLFVNLLAAAQVAVDKSADPVVKRDPIQMLVTLVGEPSADTVKEAEDAYSALLKAGTPPVAATYALGLIHTRESQYDKAVKTLDSLPNAAKYSPPILRLRLYLALERGEKRLAESLVPLLRSQVENDKSPISERLDSARLLGGIVGAIPAGNTTALSPAVVNETIRALTDAKEAKIGGAFRLAQSEATKRLAKLTLLVPEGGDKADLERSVEAAKAEESAAVVALQTSQANLAAANKEQQKVNTTGPLRNLGKQIRQIEQEWKLETPGRPREPEKPTEPKEKPFPPKGNDPKAQADYQQEVREYDRYLAAARNYPRALEEYRQQLQVWQQIDRQRRANLKALRQKAETEIAEVAAVREAEQKSKQKADTFREEVKGRQTELQEIQLKLALLRSLAAGDGGEGSRILLNRPSNYGLFSFPAERQRLLQATR